MEPISFLTAWVTSPVWSELVARMIPRRSTAGRDAVERDIRRIVRALTLEATEADPSLRLLEAGDRVTEAVVATLMALDAPSMALVQSAGVNAEILELRLRAAAPDAPADLPEGAARTLYDGFVTAACRHLVDHFTGSADFVPRTVRETRQVVGELSRRLPDADEASGAYEAVYRRETEALHGDVELHGLGLPLREQSYELGTAYVNLSVRVDDEDVTRRLGRRFEDALSQYPRLLLEGPAGAGKTTLLQHLTLLMCRGDLPEQLAHWEEREVVPLLLKVRSFATNGGLALPTPEGFVHRDVAEGKPPLWVKSLLASGRALVMVDGVDELPQADRPALMGWLRDLLRRYPSSAYVLTARPGALDADQHDQLAAWGFVSGRLEPMDVDQVDSFIRRWHETRVDLDPRTPVTQAHAEALIRALATRRDLSRLATSPLLCAMLCALGVNRRGALPKGRNAIYDDALRMLLEARDRERYIPPGALALTRLQSEIFLADLAMSMTLAARRTMGRETALAKIGNLLPRLRGVETDAPTVFHFLKERSGLLQEPVPGEIEFRHPSFQDYLAAADIFREHNLDHLIARAEDPLYHDVLIMAVGQCDGDDQRQSDVLGRLLTRARSSGEDLARTLWLLAAACVADVDWVDPAHGEEIGLHTRELLPPRTRGEATAIAKAGSFVLDLLSDHIDANGIDDEWTGLIASTALQVDADEAIPLLARLAPSAEASVKVRLWDGWSKSRMPKRYAEQVLTKVSSLAGSDIPLDDERWGLLSSMPGLTAFAIDFSCARWEALGRLSAVEFLFVGEARDFDFSLISGMRSLRMLHVEGSGTVRKTGAPADVPSLRMLQLTGLTVDGEFLRACTGLSSLMVERAGLGAIPENPCLERLTSLIVGHNPIVDIGPVADCGRLLYLDLHGTLVEDLRPLSGLSGLAELGLRGTPVRDLTPLSALNQLTKLDLGGVEVADLSPIASLEGLRELVLPGGSRDLGVLDGLIANGLVLKVADPRQR
ncbi:NACHT domain-containing protein [Actinocorallia herbida]|uniref:NACHT domain-containing protein n=1 Tax=Actinocorallia herbida TaxID=58109 RepID=A0A3N1D7T8_9ACTN|nr:NACHT domain-containing protein [Actinocorallia herbida]ROO89603.1 NACHT domain-containing protein [Actinocorallia herbida]